MVVRLVRLLRLGRALSPAFARPDDAWAATILPASELGVYLSMDPRDREHAVRVARRLVERHAGAPVLAVRAALLHDCGKCVRPFDAVERVLVGLWAPPAWFPAGRRGTPSANGRRGTPSATQVRRNHAVLGAALIRAAGGDERVAAAVENHHRPGEDELARLVHEADARE